MTDSTPAEPDPTQPGATQPDATQLDRYNETAQAAAAAVIGRYPTSFSAATNLLGKRCRPAIRNVYALVRVADEIVDGVAEAAGVDASGQRVELDALEAETLQAMQSGFSSNLVVHAFAQTARACGIDADVVRPFFASMRMDIAAQYGGELNLDAAEHEVYVYGSAQVVGLMCVRVFSRYQLARRPNAATAALLDDAGKALGSAFQNVNFLRDLADDTHRLQRSYLADGATRLDEGAKLDWVARIREDLALAEVGINLLPRDCRAGVRVAHALFSELNDRVEVTSVEDLYRERVSVPSAVKARIIASIVMKEDPWRRPWSSVRA